MVANDDTTRTRRDEASDTLVDDAGPPAAHSADRIGRYEVLEELGRGGMGVVYRARDPELDRPLAIKVVVPIEGRSRSKQKLLDEARAMAKLRHPAVVQVFDVGTTDDGVYIVMPLLAGGTLAEWAKTKRPWREVLARYVTAGRGLAAAHDAGLVHRDFKPRNVLVGDAGEVMVADFGLAATLDSEDGSVPPRTSPDATSGAGTPAYMAPEQAAGQAVDARADQYSFCISLWEALNGQRPGDAATRSGTVLPSAAVPTVPADRKGAPGWLLAAVARGFSTTPSLRWPSMTALLDQLEQRLRRPRRIAFGAGVLGMLGTGAMAFALARPVTSSDACADPRARLAGLWDAGVREKARQAFVATGVPGAAENFNRVAEMLDSYAQRWRAAHVETCRAGRVERSQSDELLDRRMACFDRNLEAMGTLTQQFVHADAVVVRKGIDGVARLPAAEDCADAQLVDVPALPSSPAIRERIADIDRRLMNARTQRSLRNNVDGVALTEPLVIEARAIGYAPLLARALDEAVNARRAKRENTDDLIRQWLDAAAAARDDRGLSRAWAALIYELARQGKFDEAAAIEGPARTALQRAGSPATNRQQLESSLGQLDMLRGQFAAAEQHYRAALAMAPSLLVRQNMLSQLASTLAQTQRIDDAIPVAEEALILALSVYGVHHPETAQPRRAVADLLRFRARPEDIVRARSLYREAIELLEATHGGTHPELALIYYSIAELESDLGQDAAAEAAVRRSLEITTAANDRLRRGQSQQLLAAVLDAQGKHDEAEPYFVAALADLEAQYGKESRRYAVAEGNFALHLISRKRYDDARAHAAHTEQVFVALKIPPMQAMALRVVGTCDLQRGDVRAFVDAMERAIAICERGACGPSYLPAFQRELGGELADRKLDAKRGVRLVKQAVDGYAAVGMTKEADEATAWLAKHAPGGK